MKRSGKCGAHYGCFLNPCRTVPITSAWFFFYLRAVLGECFFRLAGGKEKVTKATSQFTCLEKFSLNFSSSSIVIVVNHLHP